MEHLYARLDALRQKLTDEAFLENRGLSNEVGLYIFRYPPQEEMAVRAFMQGLCREMDGSAGKCRILFFDLYEILLGICRDRRILERIPQMEAQRGGAFTLAQIQKLAPPEAYVQRMQYPDHRPGDVVMIAGVGRVASAPNTFSTSMNIDEFLPICQSAPNPRSYHVPRFSTAYDRELPRPLRVTFWPPLNSCITSALM